MTPSGNPFIILGCITLQLVGLYVFYIFLRIWLICLISFFFFNAFCSVMYKTSLIWTWLYCTDIQVIFYHDTLHKPVLFSEMDASRAVPPARLAAVCWQGHHQLHLHLPKPLLEWCTSGVCVSLHHSLSLRLFQLWCIAWCKDIHTLCCETFLRRGGTTSFQRDWIFTSGEGRL